MLSVSVKYFQLRLTHFTMVRWSPILANMFQSYVLKWVLATSVCQSGSRADQPAKSKYRLKGTVHPKKKILSSLIHQQIVSNLYEFLSSVEHKIRYFEECWESNMTKKHIFQSLFFMRIKTYRFRTTWGNINVWVNFSFKTSLAKLWEQLDFLKPP